jgi:glycosyltransferase involved in cell wall biosynthesis
MRILHVSPYFSPAMGGAPRIVFQMATQLARQGHQVTVLAGDHGAYGSRFPSTGFQEVLLPCLFSRSGFYFTPSMNAWMRHHMREYDLLHLHIARTFQNIIARRHAVRLEIPFVISAHGTLPIVLQRKPAKRIFDLFFGRALFQSASRWIAVSSTEVEQYRQAGIQPEHIRLLLNGLDVDEFSCLPEHGSFRVKQHGLARETKVILFLGRLHQRKGIRYLIKAFSLLQSDFPDCVMIIAGPDDGELGFLVGLTHSLGLEDKIRFAGPLYGAERLAAMVDADVLVSPATQEIFGLVPFEAIQCNTPVIVGEDCGGGQLIREANAGYGVPFGDEETLARALRWVFSHPEEARAKVRAGQDFIRKFMDWTILVKDLECIYREVR